MPIQPQDMDHLLTFDETAARLDVSRRTLTNLVAARQIEYVAVDGRRKKFTERAILDYLNRRTAPVKAAPGLRQRGKKGAP